jgi:hypothetical protein
MKIGRNSPCPCGSGKKYKQCCLKSPGGLGSGTGPVLVYGGGGSVRGPDTGRSKYGIPTGVLGKKPSSPAFDMRQADADGNAWELDFFPFGIGVDEDPDARLGSVVVSADETPLLVDILSSTSPEIESLVQLAEKALNSLIERYGPPAQGLELTDPEVLEALEPFALERGFEVELGPCEGAREVWQRIAFGVDKRAEVAMVSSPKTWAGWGFRVEQTAEIFEVAADYYRTRPWELFSEQEVLLGTAPSGHDWAVNVLDEGELGRAVLIASDPDNYLENDRQLVRSSKASYFIRFYREDGIPKPMRREVRRRGWTLAAPDAIPVLVALGSPLGGVRQRVLDDFLAILRAVLAYCATEDRPSLDDGPWVDPATGVRLDWAPAPESDPGVN